MVQFFSVSFMRDSIKTSMVKDCTCKLEGTVFQVSKNNEIKVLEEENSEYGYIILMKTNENFEMVDYSQKLSDCCCHFFQEEANYWVIDGEYELLKITYRVDLNENVSIVSVK